MGASQIGSPPVGTISLDETVKPASTAQVGSDEHVPDLSIHEIISRAKYPLGERKGHPFHGSDTGTNFMVDSDNNGDTWHC